MTDEALKALAQRAGIAFEWRDYADKPHTGSIETSRRILWLWDLLAIRRMRLPTARTGLNRVRCRR